MICDQGGEMAVTVYPRVYEYDATTKVLWSGFSLLLVLGGAACGTCWLYDQDILQQASITAAGIALAIFGLVCLQSSLRGKLILYEQYLEYHGVFAVRRIRRDNIKQTCGAGKSFGIFAITLVMKSGRPKRVQIYDFGKMDDTFEDFINAYPNVEIEAQVAEEDTLRAAVDRNLALGSNEDQRLDTYNYYVRWVNRLKWPAIAIAAWGAFYPEPYDAGFYATLALPVVCLLAVIVFQGRLNLTDDNTSGRVPVTGLAFFSICALLLRAIATCGSMIDWIAPATVGIAAAFVLTGLIAIAERRLNWAIVWATLC